MNRELDPLILDLVDWVAREPRAYRDVIDAWRTSCPRLTVWEDCMERGFLERDAANVRVTMAGRDFLITSGRGTSRTRICS